MTAGEKKIQEEKDRIEILAKGILNVLPQVGTEEIMKNYATELIMHCNTIKGVRNNERTN
jgi:hypothetical protein